MYIFKQPKIGGEVNPHRDSSFLHTNPLSCTGLWFAIDDARLENGCLWVVPNSHNQDLVRRFIRSSDGKSASFDSEELDDYVQGSAIPIECGAGTLVILHGSLVHFSAKNLSDRSRQAFTLHVVEDHFQWSNDNWIKKELNKLSLG